jgi:hypothetical protein
MPSTSARDILVVGALLVLWWWFLVRCSKKQGEEHFVPENGGGLDIRNTSKCGRGIFSIRGFAKGEMVHRAPILGRKASQWGKALDSYLFQGQKKNVYYMGLGLASLFNHSDVPNAEWTLDETHLVMDIRALRRIRPNEQVTISYGNGYWGDRKRKTDCD